MEPLCITAAYYGRNISKLDSCTSFGQLNSAVLTHAANSRRKSPPGHAGFATASSLITLRGKRYHIGSCTQLHSTDRYHTRARRAYMPPNHYDIVNNPSSVVDTVYSARTGRRTSRCYDDSAAAAAAAAAAVKPVTLRTISFCLGSHRGWQK